MTCNEIYELHLKPRSLTEKRLVEIFASPTIQGNYKANHRFTGNEKQRVLKRASRFCKIKDCGSRMYRIQKVYTLPPNFEKMNKDVYKFTCPLILSVLMKRYDETQPAAMTLTSWSTEIHMVNKNYNTLKNNNWEATSSLQLLNGVVSDFYQKCENEIFYYLHKSFEYLKDAGLISFREVYYIQPVRCAGENIQQRPATKDELDFYEQCIAKVGQSENVQKEKQYYHKMQTEKFRQAVKTELKKGGIQSIFKKYEVSYVSLDKCEEVLKAFEFDPEKDIRTFNAALTKKLLNNANKRTLKGEFADKKEKYLNDYSKLCKLIIDHDTKYIKERLKNQ